MITEQQIRDMEPGRELDELVMDRVFAMKKKPEGSSFIWVREVDGDIEDWQPNYFCPSTNISSAWEVVEKMRLDHWYFMLSSENDGWEASFYWDAHRPSEDVLSESPAEAISKCALIAILRGGSGE